MATVKLATQLPKVDTQMNGLDQLAEALIVRPGDPHIIVALVDCAKTEIEHDGGSKTPTVRILQVEALTRRDAMAAQQMLTRARRDRISRDRTPTGGLFGDPVAETSELLKDDNITEWLAERPDGLIRKAEREANRLDEQAAAAGREVDQD